jgi:putative ABC transport system ATP-binding protein
MGSSGSGKSTLLHLIAGLSRPNAGSVLVEGRDITRLSDAELTDFRRRRIGIVFQSLNLIPSLSAEENIALPLRADGAPAEKFARVDELIDRLGLVDRRTHRPDQMSGGEQQRVAMARSLVYNPAIVLADEPTGNLDSINTERICRLLRNFNEEDKSTIVVVTHEPAVAIWADRVVLLRDGQLIDTLSTAEFEKPHELAARYHELMEVRQVAG